jgi:hypothetical protein
MRKEGKRGKRKDACTTLYTAFLTNIEEKRKEQ